MKFDDYASQILALGQGKVFRAKDLDSLGIARVYLRGLVDQGKLWQPGRGLYTATDSPIEAHQSLAEVTARCPKGIVCLLSALRYHELTSEDPSEVYLMLPQHSRAPRINHQSLRIFWATGQSYSEGFIEQPISGILVKITTPAKTVVDCFKFRNKVGVNIAVEALQDAWRSQKVTADELWKYAEFCRMTQVMKPYFEMMVA